MYRPLYRPFPLLTKACCAILKIVKTSTKIKRAEQRILTVFRLLILILLITLMTGCRSPDPVTFIVPITPEDFNPDLPINLILYDSEQIAVLERQSGCVETAQGAQVTIKCPPGVFYQEPRPEVFTFQITPDVQEVQFVSEKVKLGGQFLLVVSGQYQDRCNSISSRLESTADRDEMIVEMKDWAITLMMCIENPQP